MVKFLKNFNEAYDFITTKNEGFLCVCRHPNKGYDEYLIVSLESIVFDNISPYDDIGDVIAYGNIDELQEWRKQNCVYTKLYPYENDHFTIDAWVIFTEKNKD
jgi:hypothetical protein